MRGGFRLLFVVAGMGIVGWRALAAAHDWREWGVSAANDPSAADAWRTFFWVDLGGATVALVAILLFLRVMRRLDA